MKYYVQSLILGFCTLFSNAVKFKKKKDYYQCCSNNKIKLNATHAATGETDQKVVYGPREGVS